MGIPFFGRYLQTHYGSRILKSVDPGSCDHLCVDFNSLIHRCGRATESKRTYSTEDELYQSVYESIVRYTLSIIDLIKPRFTTYLAVDGIPPLAKMYQQRKRRFMAAKEQSQQKKTKGVVWNSGVVTPGTKFMQGLSVVMRTLLESNTIIVSGWEEDDEGEHKIFRYVRGGNVLIYGLDSDMIMLSLLHPEIQITLMREKDDVDVDNPKPEHFNYMSIKSLRGVHAKHDDGFIDDFVLLCMLIGNDFLPPLSHLSIKNDDIDKVVSLYLRVYARTRQRIVTRGSPTLVNFNALRALLQELAATEDTDMHNACVNYYEMRPRRGRGDMKWTNYPLEHKHPQNILANRPGWRMDYYHHLFHQPDVTSITQKYLEGLEWNMRYYLDHRNPKCQWFYEYSYSPTILDCVNFLQAHPYGIFPNWEKKYLQTPRITHLMLLLAVLPVTQQRLIPIPFDQIMYNVKLGCSHLYPTNFHVDTFLKTVVWECQPFLPNIDLYRLQRAIQSIE